MTIYFTPDKSIIGGQILSNMDSHVILSCWLQSKSLHNYDDVEVTLIAARNTVEFLYSIFPKLTFIIDKGTDK